MHRGRAQPVRGACACKLTFDMILGEGELYGLAEDPFEMHKYHPRRRDAQ